MNLRDFIPIMESEWEPERGFFWRVRQGQFSKDEFERTLEKIKAIPSASVDAPVPQRLISLLWYIPLFMRWQVERVQENNADVAGYDIAVNKLTNEIERILGVP